jgi:putative membrane-bound dehydrogenase-like protein
MPKISFASRAIFLPVSILAIAFAQTAVALDGPLTPEQAQKTFQLEPGLKIELVAAEPLVIDPVAVTWDENGKMYVAENRGYPVGPGKGKTPEGKIALLEDTDGDGKYDKRTTFAEGLTFPNGVMPWKGGVYVTCAPYVYYFRDTNGDGVADEKKIIFKGFQDLSTTQLRVSHPTLNIDNWVYLTSGLTAAKVRSPDWPTNRETVFLNRVDGRFLPGTTEIEATAGTAQFGQTFDNFGRKFICSNREHIQHVVMQLKYLKRNPNFTFSDVVQDIPDHGAACKVFPLSANITTAASHTGFFTSACGVTIYDGTALPPKYRGNSFTCEPAGNLVHHDVLSPSNETFVASRAYEDREFLASPDNWFRPVNLAVGPDGALYVCDMYRKTIEHPDYLPEATRKITDFTSGKDKGRIWRIVAASRQSAADSHATKKNQRRSSETPLRKADLAAASVKKLCAQFENPNRWWRMTAQRLLIERQDKSAVPILKSVVKKGKAPEARVHALRTLDGLNALEEQQILTALLDKDPNVREHGIQLAESRLNDSPMLAGKVLALAKDENPRVRFQCALSLGELQNAKIIPGLVKIAERNPDDRWMRAAVLSSIGGRANDFLSAILPAAKKSKDGALLPLLSELGRVLGSDKSNPALPTLHLMTTSTNENDFNWEVALLSGFAEGLHASRGNSSASFMGLVSIDSSTAPIRLNAILSRAQEVANTKTNSLERRLVSIQLLGHTFFSFSGNTLENLIEPTEPAEIQLAAIHALAQMPSTNGGAALVQRERWNAYTPAIRDSVLSSMMAQTNLIDALLAGVESGNVPAWSINPDRRNQLMRNKDESIRNRATKLFKDLQSGDRMKVYEEYKSVLSLTPNPANGHSVFSRTCTSCHMISGEGKSVGPDLTGIRNQPADVLLLHIIVPEYEIMPIYTVYNVETKDGQSQSGLLAGETAENITLRQAQGIEQVIPRANIASMTTSRLSLMPQELEKTMSKQDLADLIGFLKGGEAH